MSTLDWQPVPSDAGGPLFPVIFQAVVGGGRLALAVHDTEKGAGAGLTAVPAPLSNLAWRRLEASHGGPLFPELSGAAVTGGTLVAGVLNRTQGSSGEGTGTALAFVPSAVGRLEFQQVSSNLGGPTFPKLFSAPVGQGSLLAAVETRSLGAAAGLAFVPARVTSLQWVQLQQSHGGPLFPVAFAAPVSGGTLVIADLDREKGNGGGIAFVPGAVPRLDWVQLDQVQGGPRFPQHFRAPAAGGGLVLSLFDKKEGSGVDLAFLA